MENNGDINNNDVSNNGVEFRNTDRGIPMYWKEQVDKMNIALYESRYLSMFICILFLISLSNIFI